jgi:uncharacterized SAM-binding protein YcdF (DUF218 family)
LLVLAALIIKRRNWQRAALLFALALLYLSSNTWVTEALARSLEWRYLPRGDLPQADIILVLSGGHEPADYPRPGPEIGGDGDRLIYAARLYKQGKASRLLLSGGTIEWINNSGNPAEDMAELLELMGVPRRALILETESRNTYENARACKGILDELGARQVILVTSAWHMPRSVLLFQKQGIKVIPAPTDFIFTRPNLPQPVTLASLLYDLLPGPENLARTTLLLKEYLGLFIYKLRGWI